MEPNLETISFREDQIQSSLQKHFSSSGEITRVSVPKDYGTGAIKGIAYMVFSDNSTLSNAMELSGSDVGAFSLFADEAKPRPDNRDGAVSNNRGRSGRARNDDRGGRSGSTRGVVTGVDAADPLAEVTGAAVVTEGVVGVVHLRGRVLLQLVQGRRSLWVMTDSEALKHNTRDW
ncbi:hypothetical protein QYE76_046328 [Lolium multiflorum]|uniref:RRM domain-containing protein n=1 Tax=Lolium multiflorum TaxID=4521 RepID=A0AAD8TMR3_LOLMU|nr:hypothetical protein QYE76_046328 [Lolium multiflorum]